MKNIKIKIENKKELNKSIKFLKKIYLSNYKEYKKIIEQVFLNINKKNFSKTLNNYYKETLDQQYYSLENIKNEFNPIEHSYNFYLEKLLDVKQNEKLTAYLSIIPICPRDLTHNSFNIYLNSPKNEKIAIIAHEIFHFYYFKKLKNIYPKLRKKQREHPYFFWYLSELIDDYILYKDKFLQNIIKTIPEPNYYKDAPKIIQQKISELYIQFKNSDENFSDFIKNTHYEILLLHKYIKTIKLDNKTRNIIIKNH